jgi:flagellar hook protein FlgE
MSVSYSMFSGVSGLKGNSDKMAVISNNIANSSTRGYKTDRAEFEDLLAVSLNENSQLGRGVRLRNIKTIHTQGAVSNTGVVTDLAIQGEGFFVVNNPATEASESGGKLFTRQGAFQFDRDGFLSDSLGGRLQGYMADPMGRLSTKLSDVQIASNSIPPTATQVVTMNTNLDVRSKPPLRSFDITDPEGTSNFQSTVSMYDSFGETHACTVYFSKVDEGGANKWKWHATVPGNELAENPGLDAKGNQIAGVIAEGEITFDTDGTPILPFQMSDGRRTFFDIQNRTDAKEVKFANGSKTQQIQFNFGPQVDPLTSEISTMSSTSMATKSSTMFHSQDGHEAGYLKSLKIELDGSIQGVFTNGLQRRLGGVALATFPSTDNLQKIGRNSYVASNKSGSPRIGMPQSGTRGSIYSASIEESNVDLADQFVNMITTQRAFQANSKSITTTDAMMDEVIGLKR